MKVDSAMEIGGEHLIHDPLDTGIDNSQLCRICANPNDYLIPIFQGEGLEHELKSKIAKHLPIKVSESDKLPTQLCYQCASTLIAWHDLVVACIEAEEKFNRHLKEEWKQTVEIKAETTKDSCTSKYSAETQSDEVVDQGNIDLEDWTEVVTENTLTESPDEGGKIIIEEVKTMAPESPEEVSTDSRSLPFRNYLLATHSLKTRLLQPDCKAPQSLSVNMACQKKSQMNLKKSSESKKDDMLMSPENSEHDQTKHECNFCDRCFNRACDLKRHSLIHINTTPLESSECQNLNFDDDERSSDMYSKTIVTFTCEICSRTFKVKNSFERHKRIHTGERPFQCNECGKRFRDSGALSRHVKEVHAKIRNHKCNVCNKWFVNRATLEDHHRTHTGERPFVCHHCGIMFKSRAALYQHNKTHSDYLPHVCPYCGKGFRRRQELVAHTPTHTNEKTHICDKCGKRFSTRSELKRHIVVHSDEKLFNCASCSLSFSQKRYLKSHVKTKHGGTEESSPGILPISNLGLS